MKMRSLKCSIHSSPAVKGRVISTVAVPTKIHLLTAIIAILLSTGNVFAQSETAVLLAKPDSLTAQQDSLAVKPGFMKRVVKYFEESNKDKSQSKFDVSFIGGPSYSVDANSAKPVSTNAVFHTLLNTAGIQTPFRRDELSLVSPNFVEKPRMYLNDHDVGVPYQEMNLKQEDFEMLEKNKIRY